MTHRKIRRYRRLAWFALAIGLVSLGVLGRTVAQSITKYDPLGQYPLQRVDSRVEGLDGPAVKVGDQLVVSGVKCVAVDTEVTVEGVARWVPIDPPGGVYGEFQGGGPRQPGCQRRTYHNDIPESVIRRARAFADAGQHQTVWQITGVETPIRPDGSEGEQRTWATENFIVVYPDDPADATEP